MPNKVLLTFLGIDFLFVVIGALLLAAVFIFHSDMHSVPTTDNVATNMLLQNTPLEGVFVNAIAIVVTFLLSLPAVFLSKNRYLLRIHSFLVIGCAIFTMVLGLEIWYSTLKTRSKLGALWAGETSQEQSLLQQRFNCCGYLNYTSPPFSIDSTCPNAAAAALKPGCVGPFSSFANSYLDIIFTAMFGIVALDGFLFLSVLVVLKDRAEKERYRLIDEKLGFGGI